MKTKIVLLAMCLLAFGSINFAQGKKTNAGSVAPEQIVKNLYAARKSPKTDPFFQKKSRARVDKYFAKNLADLIWKDANRPGDGVGGLDFDPLYAAQDTKITNFMIGKADADGVVTARFKNMGINEEVKFFLIKETTASKVWKIETIMYRSADDLGAILENVDVTEAEINAAESANKLNGDYLVGSVKCNVETNISGYYARVKCDDQEDFQVIDTETLTFGNFNPNEKGRRGNFVLAADGSIGEFVDASGKKMKVTRVK